MELFGFGTTERPNSRERPPSNPTTPPQRSPHPIPFRYLNYLRNILPFVTLYLCTKPAAKHETEGRIHRGPTLPRCSCRLPARSRNRGRGVSLNLFFRTPLTAGLHPPASLQHSEFPITGPVRYDPGLVYTETQDLDHTARSPGTPVGDFGFGWFVDQPPSVPPPPPRWVASSYPPRSGG